MMYSWIIVAVLLVIGIWFYKTAKISNRSDSANDILDKRYSNGEISKEEYMEQKDTLNQKNE